jgi:hypothetical protein
VILSSCWSQRQATVVIISPQYDKALDATEYTRVPEYERQERRASPFGTFVGTKDLAPQHGCCSLKRGHLDNNSRSLSPFHIQHRFHLHLFRYFALLIHFLEASRPYHNSCAIHVFLRMCSLVLSKSIKGCF